MSRTNMLTAVISIFFALAAPLAYAGGGGNKSSDSIWVANTGAAPLTSSTMSPGSTFSAGYSSKTAYPWAHAQCYGSDGSAFWGEWRAPQANGTIGVFDLTTANSGVTWPSGATRCTLDLVNTKNYSVLASTSFTVAG